MRLKTSFNATQRRWPTPMMITWYCIIAHIYVSQILYILFVHSDEWAAYSQLSSLMSTRQWTIANILAILRLIYAPIMSRRTGMPLNNALRRCLARQSMIPSYLDEHTIPLLKLLLQHICVFAYCISTYEFIQSNWMTAFTYGINGHQTRPIMACCHDNIINGSFVNCSRNTIRLGDQLDNIGT